MSLLKKLVCRRISLVILSVCINIFAGAVSLRWNMQISSIINLIHANDPIAIRAIIAAVLLILISVVAEYLLSMCSGWTCETLAHDLRIGYAKYFTTLPLAEIENMNAGE